MTVTTPPYMAPFKHIIHQISHRRIFTTIAALWTLFMILLWIYWNHIELAWDSVNPQSIYSITASSLEDDIIHVNWTEFAYVQYATDKDYLCNSVMIFEQLHNLETKPVKVLLYPKEWDMPVEENNPPSDPSQPQSKEPTELELLHKARDQYNVTLRPVQLINLESEQEYWSASFTKLQIFNLTEYKRMLVMDSDSTVQKNLDHLFLAPSAPVAAPRSYWSERKGVQRITLTSLLMLVEPSAAQSKRVVNAMSHRGPNDYDMEIINDLFKDDCLILPHRGLALLSGDLRRKTHRQYMGSSTERWDAVSEFNNTALIHFSDYPYPKPWMHVKPEDWEEVLPKCIDNDCTQQKVWSDLTLSFQTRREQICGLPLRELS